MLRYQIGDVYQTCFDQQIDDPVSIEDFVINILK